MVVECHLGEHLEELRGMAQGVRGVHRDPMARFLADRCRIQKPAGRPDEAMTASTAVARGLPVRSVEEGFAAGTDGEVSFDGWMTNHD